MVSTCLLISKSSSLFTKPFWIAPSAHITIDITVTFMFHSFLVLWQGLSPYLSFRFQLFLLCDYYHYYYYYHYLEFPTSALADGISQEFEWQQVSSSLQDSSQ